MLLDLPGLVLSFGSDLFEFFFDNNTFGYCLIFLLELFFGLQGRVNAVEREVEKKGVVFILLNKFDGLVTQTVG